MEQNARWISHAEGKANLTLASAGVTGGVLFSVTQSGRHLGLPAVCTASACAVFILAACLSAIISLWPRRAGPGDSSLLYFHDISTRYPKSPGSYVEALRVLLRAPDDLTGEIAGQIWALARVATRKYTWANRGLACLSVGLVLLGTTCALLIRL